ncbi:MAG: CehA/McbA family metallohydrolase [Pirellulaceae bacterium]
MRRFVGWIVLVVAVVCGPLPCCFAEDAAQPLVLTERLHHLRLAGPREWSDFPEQPQGSHLELKFTAKKNTSESAFLLRQQDVKQGWRVLLNGEKLGRLVADENDMVIALGVPAGRLRDGENVLQVEQEGQLADDVRVGQVVLHSQPVQEVLAQASVQVELRDVDSGERLPGRLTIVNEGGSLQTVGATSSKTTAVRRGVIYTSTGQAEFGLPPGKYTIYAGRGFEYSLDSKSIDFQAGERLTLRLKIRREVPTKGYVACDTHTHTLTHSGHGDATVEERMITLAGEGIELPIATDHNRHVDQRPFARAAGVEKYFTPVIGNEVTTPSGHFNIFPVQAEAKVPDFQSKDWKTTFDGIYRTPDVKAVVLNHARDLHSGVRPFGPKLHNAVVGENLEGWQLRANAMEVVNSGAVQSEPLRLLQDWMGMLNRGLFLTPVGASDSHDVARFIVGQGRTYIRARDDDPGAIDIDEAVNSFVQGSVSVSYGLLTELTVGDKFGPGDLAPAKAKEVRVKIRVLGPHWVRADRVLLFANGQLVREEAIRKTKLDSHPATGVLWEADWKLERPRHDVHLVAVALGPGIDGLYWPTARPYQPTSTVWKSQVIGASGAVWLDGDGDGRKTPAYEYAREAVKESGGDLKKLLVRLADYDEAVAALAAHLWQAAGKSLLAEEAQGELKIATPKVAQGVRVYLDAWRENQAARGGDKP